MKESEKYLHKHFLHPELGLVSVDSIVSRVIVNIMCLQRAEGWNDATEQYERYKVYSTTLNVDKSGYKSQWRLNRESNDQYGHKDTCHIDCLAELQESKSS